MPLPPAIFTSTKSIIPTALSTLPGCPCRRWRLRRQRRRAGTITPHSATSPFLFNYAPDAGASFWAGNSITLGVGNLLRNASGKVPTPIYPASLTLEAGAGGITFDKSIVLFPSPEGSLNIVTHDGGDLSGVFIQGAGVGTGLTMSDSGLPGWSTFATGHAVTPVHLADGKRPQQSGQFEHLRRHQYL